MKIPILLVLIVCISGCHSKQNMNLYYMPDANDYGVKFQEAKHGKTYHIGNKHVPRKIDDQDFIIEGGQNRVFEFILTPYKISKNQFDQIDVITDRLEFYEKFEKRDSLFFIIKESDTVYRVQPVKELISIISM